MAKETQLKKVIRSKGLKQKWVAEQLGINHQAMNRLTNGKTLPSMKLAYKFARLLEKSVEELWTWDEVMNGEDE